MRHRLSMAVALSVFTLSTASASDYEVRFRALGLEPTASFGGEYASCADIKRSAPGAATGVYELQVAGEAYSAYCDMDTDGGGWTLVLNCLHRGGTNPGLLPLTNRLPVAESDQLGIDESNNQSAWGHTAPQLFANLDVNELRFQCKTSAHGREIHFKTSNAERIAYFGSGNGSYTNITDGDVLPGGEQAYLPGAISSGFTREGIFAMTEHPLLPASELSLEYSRSRFTLGVR